MRQPAFFPQAFTAEGISKLGGRVHPDDSDLMVTNDGRVFRPITRTRYTESVCGDGDWIEVRVNMDPSYPTTQYGAVHILVAETFLGPRPDGLFICHNDGNSRNFNLSNLRYDSRKKNAADTHVHASHLTARRRQRTPASEKKVQAVITLTPSSHEFVKALAAKEHRTISQQIEWLILKEAQRRDKPVSES